MSARFVQPVAPYEAPNAFQEASLPLAAVAYDPATPGTEVIDKGSQFSHSTTKSTFNVPNGYQEADACGNEFYTKANVSSSINQTVDCNIVKVFQGSLNVTVAKDMSEADFSNFVNALKAALYAKISELA